VIDPALRKSLGQLQVTVFNPTPGGGTSSPVVLTLYSMLPINPIFVASVPQTNRLYAAIPATDTSHPNTVIPITPLIGTLGTPIPVGNNPRLLAPSGDGKYLYVALGRQ